MESTRSVRRHGSIRPAIFSLLAELPAASISPAAHGLRAPGGIYNLSMNRILEAFLATLDALAVVEDAVLDDSRRMDSQASSLLAAHTELLEAMLAHIDDGYQILKACHPPQADIAEVSADQWLEKARHRHVRHFKNAVRGYRDDLAPIVNRVKHAHGQLRLVAFVTGSKPIIGYYLEGIDTAGVAGPDTAIHPGCTARSFNRDLRLHFVHVYEIGNALKAALAPALRDLGFRATGRLVESQNDAVATVAARVEALGVSVFPDEVRKPTPHVQIGGHGDALELAVRYPSLATFRAARDARVTTLIKGDGYTTQYRMPYFAGEDAPDTSSQSARAP